jgi:hypothetical protein
MLSGIPSDIYSWENMTREERREYMMAHLGTDDGNERVARLGLDVGGHHDH